MKTLIIVTMLAMAGLSSNAYALCPMPISLSEGALPCTGTASINNGNCKITSTNINGTTTTTTASQTSCSCGQLLSDLLAQNNSMGLCPARGY